MDWLFRFFYTVLSLSILMIALLPFIAVFRFLLRNYKKKHMIWGWRIFFLRSICPVALSSAFCMISSINRRYHLILANLGLTVEGKGGIMTSWRAVYQGEISVTKTFQICSVIWAAGIVGFFLLAMIFNLRFRKELKKAEPVGENIYESASISVPVSRGIFRKKIYLPKGFQAKEMSWLLRHMQAHRFVGIRSILAGVIVAIHWFNPIMWLYYVWWKTDMEMAADEQTVFGESESTRKEYAQEILNFNKESYEAGTGNRRTASGILLFPGVIEENIEKRVYRMLYRKKSRRKNKLADALLFSITIIFLFLLTPMRMAWDGGTWGNGNTSAKTKTVSRKSDTTLVTRMKTTSPEGLERVIQLEMLSGEEGNKEYVGNFELRMYDSIENIIASCKVENLFPEIEKGQQKFSKDTVLCISDYNGDGAKELAIGQQTKVSANYVTYEYAVVSIEDRALKAVCTGIKAVGRDTELGNSIYLEKPEEIDDIFLVPKKEKTLYYVWDAAENTYKKQKMTAEMLEKHKKGIELSNSGETQEHSLEDESGKEGILVSTKQDSTGSEEIQSVIIAPGSGSKRFDDIEGYYCDLLWVTDENEKEKKDYAQLIYNGTKAQTFVIYDIAKQFVYYRHEDGTKQLADVFKQYGENITFQENGTVIYSLMVKEGDVIKIGFAANADNGITVNGNYEYDVVKHTAYNLSFNRSGDGTASPISE